MQLFEVTEPRCDHCAEHDAFHEAGHAVMAVIGYRRIRRELYRYHFARIAAVEDLADHGLAGDEEIELAWDLMDKVTRGPVDDISIIPDPSDNSDGHTNMTYFLADRNLEAESSDPRLQALAEAECQVMVAGIIAQAICDPDSADAISWGDDRQIALGILQALDVDRPDERLQEIMDETRAILIPDGTWEAVNEVAQLLVEKKTISGHEARTVIETALDRGANSEI